MTDRDDTFRLHVFRPIRLLRVTDPPELMEPVNRERESNLSCCSDCRFRNRSCADSSDHSSVSALIIIMYKWWWGFLR